MPVIADMLGEVSPPCIDRASSPKRYFAAAERRRANSPKTRFIAHPASLYDKRADALREVVTNFISGGIDRAGFGTAREPNYRTLGGAMPGVLAEYVVLDGTGRSRRQKTGIDAKAS